MSEKKYPIAGYAPGGYQRTCIDCKERFIGDKRAFQCEPCAEKAEAWYNSLTEEQREDHHKKFAEAARKVFEEFKNKNPQQ